MSSIDQDDLRHIIAAVLANASAQTDDLKTPKALVRRFVEIYSVLDNDDTMDELMGSALMGRRRPAQDK